MKRNIESYKDLDGVVKFRGEVDLYVGKSKSVTVDGETYFKEWRELKTFKVEEAKTSRYSLEFNALGVVQKWEHPRLFFNDEDVFEQGSSSNLFACASINFFKSGYLDKRITDVYTWNKRGGWRPFSFDNIIQTQKVPLLLFEYGWGNEVLYEIDLKKLSNRKFTVNPGLDFNEKFFQYLRKNSVINDAVQNNNEVKEQKIYLCPNCANDFRKLINSFIGG